jgi:hypothetical protein
MEAAHPPQGSRKSSVLSIVAALVAIGIIVGIVAGLYVLYAVQAAREANRLRSMNHMKQIALALSNFEIVYKSLPPHAVYSEDGQPLLSWRVLVVPFLEESDQPGLHREFQMDEPWDSPHNRQLVERMPAVCGNANLPAGTGATNYLAVVGEGCAFDGTPQGRKVNMIAADTPETIVIVEADLSRAVPWTKPDDLTFDAESLPAGLGRLRPEGWYAAWADGYVKEVPPDSPQASPKSFLLHGN